MPGSRRPFTYTDDEGRQAWMDLDESIYEVAALGMGQTVSTIVAQDPNNRIKATGKSAIEPRHILCVAATGASAGTARRQFFVGSTSADVWDGALTVAVDGQTWSILSRVGEIRHYPPTTDTELLDGDLDLVIDAGTP